MGASAEVQVVDRVVLPGEQVEGWLARWRVGYAEGARARGLTLVGVQVGYAGPETVDVCVTWTLPDAYAFYGMRSAAGADPAVAEFWAATDRVAVERDRRVSSGRVVLGWSQIPPNVSYRKVRTSPAQAKRWVALAASADELVRAGAESLGQDLPGSLGGLGVQGDFVSEPSLDGAVELDTLASHTVALDGARVKRTLLLTVRPGTSARDVARFEADLIAMPTHISSIRSWALSRTFGGRWTHCWEQEFADVDGLVGEYLLHPYHWTYVDRWFDGELPTSIVQPDIAHVFRWTDRAVLGY